MPPGSSRWIPVAAALDQFSEEGQRPSGSADLPQWVPLERYTRIGQRFSIDIDDDEGDPAEMDMLPMIDITTLLLIFFLVGGVFMLQTRVDLPKAQTGEPVMRAERMPVAILIDQDPEKPGELKIAFEDESTVGITVDSLIEGYQSRVAEGSIPEVVLRAQRAIPFGKVREIMKELAKASPNAIRVAIEEPRGRASAEVVEE